MKKLTFQKQKSIQLVDMLRKSCFQESIKPSITHNEFTNIKHKLMILKRDVKAEREANRKLFKKLVDAKSEVETLKKKLGSYRSRITTKKINFISFMMRIPINVYSYFG